MYGYWFVELLQEKLDTINLEDKINTAINTNLSRNIIKTINNNITYALNAVRKQIEGLVRVIPYSKVKIKRRKALLY